MAIERTKLRNLADISIDKAHLIVLLLIVRWRKSTSHRCEIPQNYHRPLETNIHL